MTTAAPLQEIKEEGTAQAKLQSKPVPTVEGRHPLYGTQKREKVKRQPGELPPGTWRHAPSKVESQALPPFTGIPLDRIHVPSTDEELASARAALTASPVLGFDTEERPNYVRGFDNGGPHLVQLSTTTDAWLLQIHLNAGAAEIARAVMSNSDIIKVGFGLANDRKSLPRKLGVELKNIVDLDTRFRQNGFPKHLGVRAAIAVVYGQDFRKPKGITMSDWDNEWFTPLQREYAANDAYTAALLWDRLPQWEAEQKPRVWWEKQARERAKAAAEAKKALEESQAAQTAQAPSLLQGITTRGGFNEFVPRSGTMG